MSETMLDRRLQRIAENWQARADAGQMPDALYRAIAEGSEGAYETKVIRNLARCSRIINDNGEVRKFSDFKNDWRYSHSTYGCTDTCEICGQRPIVENCVLKDDLRNKEIIVGNRCVQRYMDILDPQTGEVMSDEQKASFLKSENKTAKDEYTRQQWADRHPFIMEQLKEYEAFMQSQTDLRRLHTEVSKRMLTHGYPGAKARRKWEMFLATADASLANWERTESER